VGTRFTTVIISIKGRNNPSRSSPFLRLKTPILAQSPRCNGGDIPLVNGSVLPCCSLRPIHRLRRVTAAQPLQPPWRRGQENPPVQVIYFFYYHSLQGNITHRTAPQPIPSSSQTTSTTTTPGTQRPSAGNVSEPSTSGYTMGECSHKHRLDHVFPLIWHL
jgi:hypothetical protein